MKRLEEEIFNRVRILMERDHLFLDPHITLIKLSVIVGTNTLYLSRAINHCTGHNFRTFLNNYRIDYATRLIRRSKLDNQRISLLCKQCGFTSNSVFHIAFKERMNVTPMQYIHNCMAKTVSDEWSHIHMPNTKELSNSTNRFSRDAFNSKNNKTPKSFKITTNSNHYEEKVY